MQQEIREIQTSASVVFGDRAGWSVLQKRRVNALQGSTQTGMISHLKSIRMYTHEAHRRSFNQVIWTPEVQLNYYEWWILKLDKRKRRTVNSARTMLLSLRAIGDLLGWQGDFRAHDWSDIRVQLTRVAKVLMREGCFRMSTRADVFDRAIAIRIFVIQRADALELDVRALDEKVSRLRDDLTKRGKILDKKRRKKTQVRLKHFERELQTAVRALLSIRAFVFVIEGESDTVLRGPNLMVTAIGGDPKSTVVHAWSALPEGGSNDWRDMISDFSTREKNRPLSQRPIDFIPF